MSWHRDWVRSQRALPLLFPWTIDTHAGLEMLKFYKREEAEIPIADKSTEEIIVQSTGCVQKIVYTLVITIAIN